MNQYRLWIGLSTLNYDMNCEIKLIVTPLNGIHDQCRKNLSVPHFCLFPTKSNNLPRNFWKRTSKCLTSLFVFCDFRSETFDLVKWDLSCKGWHCISGIILTFATYLFSNMSIITFCYPLLTRKYSSPFSIYYIKAIYTIFFYANVFKEKKTKSVVLLISFRHLSNHYSCFCNCYWFVHPPQNNLFEQIHTENW